MKLFMYNQIDSTTAKGILKDLSKDTDSQEITLHINSPGGNVLDGYAIYNQLRQSGKKITVNIDGMAGSIASVIAMAGSEINISEAGRIMIHNPMAAIKGDSEALKKAANTLTDFTNDLVRIYSKRTKLNQKTIREMMDSETILTAKEAVSLGFADNIINPIKAVAKFENNDMDIVEKLKALAKFKTEEKPEENEVTAEVEETAKAEIEEKKDTEDPAELLMQDYVNSKDYTEFKAATEAFEDAMIDFAKSQPTKEEIANIIQETTNKMFLDFVAKIKSTGNVPTKTETEANFVKEQTGQSFWNEIEEGIKEINDKK